MTDLLINAQRLHTAGQYDEAEKLYAQIIDENPHDAEALYLLGSLLAQQGKFEAGLTFLRRAVIENPGNSIYHCNLGVAQQNLNFLDEALASFWRSIKCDKRNMDAYYNLAKLYKQLNLIESAFLCYEQVLSIDSSRFDALINMGNILVDRGLYDNAIDHFQRAIEVNFRSIRAYINLGNTYRRMGLSDQAVAAYDHVLSIRSHDGLRIKRAVTLPVVYESVGHIDEVREEFTERVRELEEDDLSVIDPSLEPSTTTFFLAYQNQNNRDLQSAIARVHLRSCPGLGWTAPHCEVTQRHTGKIRIGYLSCYFRLHSIGRLMVGIITRMPKDQFEVVVITVRGQRDQIAQAIEGSADEILYLSEDFYEAQREIGLKELDVLFFSDIGMDVRTYFLAFARLAPIQCVTWGHPDTTGIPNVDTFFSGSLIEPAGADKHYSEELFRLSSLPTYYLRPTIPERLKSRADFGLDDKQHLYLCAQSTIKFHPDVDDLFAHILRGDVDGTVLVVEGDIPNWDGQVKNRWAQTIGDVNDRIEFVPRQSPENFVALQAVADVILDTPHFSGGNTTYEAFTIGKPVVTLDSSFMRGRVTAGMYRIMNIEECTAQSLTDYGPIALKLGMNTDYRRLIEAKIRERSEVLFERQEVVDGVIEYIKKVSV